MTTQNNNDEQIHSEGKSSYRVPIAWRFDLIPPCVERRLAAIYEEGAQKYGEAKYIEQPLPESVIWNHIKNHENLWLSGDRSEDHLAKVMWGIATLMNMEEMHTDGFLDSIHDVTKYGAKANEAIQKRARNLHRDKSTLYVDDRKDALDM